MSDTATARAELLARRLERRTRRISGDPDAITTVPRDGRLRCSFGQERLWFLATLTPDSPEYHVPLVLRLTGELDVGALRAALSSVVARHEILRTRYTFDAAEPLQMIDEPSAVALPVYDLRDAPAAGRLDAAVAAARRDIAVPFDLGLDHPMRCALRRIGNTDHVLSIVVHHIAFDGWSAGVLIEELLTAYAAGAEAGLDTSRVQYADVAAWERRQMSGARLDDHLSYWRTQLADLQPLELPTDRPRPAVRDWAGDSTTFEIDATVAARLRELATAHDTTLFTVALAVLAVLLGRHGDSDDVTVGTAMTGRRRPELRSAIGFFLRTVAVRVRWAADPTVADLLDATRRTVVDAMTHAEAPMQLLVGDVDRRRDLSRPPLFQVMFDLVEAQPPVPRVAGLVVEALDVVGAVAKHDLRLELREQADGSLRGVMEYPTSLFDRKTIEALSRRYRTLATAFAADPGRRLSALEMLACDELERLAASATGPPPGADLPWVPDAVAAWARRTPDATAVRAGGIGVRYAELDTDADRLARRLRGMGIGPEDLVGVCLPRGPGLLPALLAVWRAGGAYLPLDPDDPPARLRDLLADAGAGVVLGNAATAPRLDVGDRRVVVVDDDPCADVPAQEPADVAFDPDRLAYVIYTSGSTGAPKGVQVPHGALRAYLDWAVRAYAPAGPASAPLFSSAAFDLVMTTLYVPLLTGGTVHVMPAGLGTAELADRLLDDRDGRYDFVKMTPAHLELLAQQLGPERADALAARLVAGGDLFRTPLARWWHEHTTRRPVVLVNEYGPTETTVGDIIHRSTPVDRTSTTAVALPIGRPAPGNTGHVLDGELRRAPTGVPGQLYLGGRQVARGYLGRPDLTAERFVPDPFGPPGSRMYRSGDLARVTSDGALEFAGRIDDQLKIRGHRIEPAEIVAALVAHPDIAEAVVRPRLGDDGPDGLVAYVVGATGDPPAPAALRDHLEARLAAHLVPDAYVALSAVPLTPNGKVDHHALPDPDRDAAGVTTRTVAPRTPLEHRITAAMSRVLQVEGLGAEDAFFEVGGDSLSAVALVGRLREAGMDVSVHDLFGHPTAADLATLVENRPDATDRSHVAAFELLGPTDRARLPDGIVDAYPLSTLQAGMALEMLGGDVLYYLNVTSFTVREPSCTFDHAAFQRAVSEVVASREVLRTAFALRGYSEPLQLVHAAARLPVGLTDLRDRPEPARDEELRAFVTRERRRPFDVAAPPLLRLHVHLHDDRRWSLTITEHHAILEGWSFHTLLMEILECYRRIRDHGTVAVADPPAVRYADFVAAERAAIERGDDLAYWRAALDGAARFTLPPTWGDAGAAGAAPFRVDVLYADLVDDLEALATAAGATLKHVLHAAHLKVLSMLTPETSFFGGLICDTRPEARDADRLYGLFLNAVPFPVTVTARSWTQLVQVVFATEADLWAHRRYPMAKLQQAIGRGRLVDVIFNYLDFRVIDEELLDVSQVIDDSPTEFLLNVTAFRQGMISLRMHPTAVSRSDADRLAALYRGVLAAMAADPGGDAGSNPLPAAQRHRLLYDSNDTGVARDGATVPDLFARQVAATPDAVAIVGTDGSATTYAALDHRAAALADRLATLGSGPEDVVGVLLPRSVDLVAAVLAIGMAGAAYLPLDPAHPPQRSMDTLAVAGAAVLLTSGPAADAPSGVQVVDIADVAAAADGPTSGPVRRADPGNLAYVLYTSGSTGSPKGVMVTQAGVCNYLLWAAETYGVDTVDGAPLLTSVAFDLTVTSLLLPLVRGRAVTLLPDDADLAHQAAHVGGTPHVGTLKVVPSHLDLLASRWTAEADAGGIADVVVGGEELFVETVRKARRYAPDLTIFNEYGPTETVVGCTTYRVPADVDPAHRIPIGRPIANTRLYVLDSGLEPVPVGVPGELYIGGDVVARGYRLRPGLTAERFVPDPYAATPGARCYRTGDLVSVRPDGDLVFHARVDDQLKIHGYRIEPAEVEAAVTAHPDVTAAAVTAYHPPDGDARLVAHVVTRDDAPVEPGRLRSFLRTRLPEYLVPATIVGIAELPRGTTGKVDRARLPAPTGEAVAFVPARDATERRLTDIWRRLLGIDRIGVHDDLVSLGADSLSGLRLAAEAAELGFDVDPLTVLAHGTIAGQARHLLGGDSSDAIAEMIHDAELDPAIRPSGRSSPTGDAVLLTGATGFLGAGLLEQLLRQTSGRVICLVRADDVAHATRRVRDEIEAWPLLSPDAVDRVEVVAGDLAAPRFGLDAHRWRGLAARVHAIYHCAASTNAVHPYRTMRPTNVDGTVEILRLACLDDSIHVHHVSTMSVFSDDAFDAGTIDEDSVQPTPPYPSNGYAQSKWVAETLVREAGRRGVPATIYRMGKVSWDSRTGRFNASDLFSRTLDACIELGASPAARYAMTLTPVDHVAAGIVAVAQRSAPVAGAVHVVSRHRTEWDDVFAWLNRSGTTVRQVDYEQWRELLAARVRRPGGERFTPLLLVLPSVDDGFDIGHGIPDDYVPAATTVWEQATSGCPPVDEPTFSVLIGRMTGRGAPRTAARTARAGSPGY